jgi:hypothetical protein
VVVQFDQPGGDLPRKARIDEKSQKTSLDGEGAQ